jgi:arginyl-tRNA synthetase
LTRDPLADFDREIQEFLRSADVATDRIRLETPAEREFGERSSNIALQLAAERKQPPAQIAQEIAERFNPDEYRFISRVEPAGVGFLNFRLNYEQFVAHAISSIREAGQAYGRRGVSEPRHIVVEHTSVNPNKEWHIGHVRNAVIGDSLGRLLRLAGHHVEIQNYIDDTGLQAAQAIVGMQDFPEDVRASEKRDHYVGRLYVKVAAELAAEEDIKKRLDELADGPVADADSRENLGIRLENIQRLKRRTMQAMDQLEKGEHQAVTQAILNAQLETACRLGIYYDLLSWESHLVKSGLFQEAMQLLGESPRVYTAREGKYAGALVIEIGPSTRPGEKTKVEVLIRSSGIPTYVGKDIAYHMWKFHILPDRLGYIRYSAQPNASTLWSTALGAPPREIPRPDEVVNVVAVNQSQAQNAVKEGLRAAGYPEAAEDLTHLAYGLVSTSEGRLSGRKGTSVAGDDVIDEAVRVALERVQEKRTQELTDEEMRSIAEAVGVGSIRYFMIQYNPSRQIVFDVAKVVSYDGNTALYIQYALVRMFAILRKAKNEQAVSETAIENANASLLQREQERRLIYHLAQYPGLVADASRTLAINLVAEYAYDLATIFSQFYRDCPVLLAGNEDLRNARLLLVRTVRDVLTNACEVLGVPVIERL